MTFDCDIGASLLAIVEFVKIRIPEIVTPCARKTLRLLTARNQRRSSEARPQPPHYPT
jgi:hypothetical protein